MSEELKNVRGKVEVVQKEKVDNTILKEALNDLKEERKERNIKTEKRDEAIQQNQRAIQKILIRQELAAPRAFKVMDLNKEKSPNRIIKKSITIKKKEKPNLSPDQFEIYLSMSPETRAKYKKYLRDSGKDVSGLPD